MGRPIKHRDTIPESQYFNLYCQWNGIKARCNNHTSTNYKHYGAKGVSICSEWLEWSIFKQWAIDNKWKKGYNICRTGDTGNYEPNNCRIDTLANNLKEAAKNYTLINPQGEVVHIHNMKEYCKDKDLVSNCMTDLAKGKRKSHKGWKSLTQGISRYKLNLTETTERNYVYSSSTSNYSIERC